MWEGGKCTEVVKMEDCLVGGKNPRDNRPGGTIFWRNILRDWE